MKKFIAAALLTSALVPVAFANSNAGSKLYVSSTFVSDNDMAQADFEALTWVEVKNIGNIGETGTKTNMLSYDVWSTTTTQKAKGLSDAGSPTIEVARKYDDAGQIILRTAGAITNTKNYAFKIVRNDAITDGGTGTILYNRGLVSGPARPNGKNEDFDLEVFTLGLQQSEVVVAPTAGGAAPEFTAAPAITGTIEVGEIATCSTGTVTGSGLSYAYQWFAGGVAIVGATANTFTILTAQLGKKLQCRVNATNTSGSAVAMSDLTAAVAP